MTLDLSRTQGQMGSTNQWLVHDVVQQTNNSSLYPLLSSQHHNLNWGEICMNALVDYFITKPSFTLTSPDGYTLTQEGERVLR